jgi:OFA family oxalate/formate antiporter-like MFS transporter
MHGVKHYSANYGIAFSAYSIVSFFAPRIAARIETANNGDYTKAFYTGIAVALTGLVISTAFIRHLKKTMERNMIKYLE